MRRSTEIAIALALSALGNPAAAAPPEYEPPEALPASAVVPQGLRQSIHHTVLDDVQLDDGFFVFRVESNVGVYQVRSLALLAIRIHEIKTMAESRAQFNDADDDMAAAARGRQGVGSDSVVDLFTDPVRTASGLASNFSSNLEQTLSGKYLEPSDAAIEAPAGGDGAPGPYKRSVASQLTLDVYSSNPDVQGFLDRLATARSAGRLDDVTATVSPAAADTIGLGDPVLQARVEALIKNDDPGQLRAVNARRLQGLRMPAAVTQRFLDNPNISPRNKSYIVASLELLGGVGNLNAVIELAGEAGSEVDALAYRQLARMLTHYHRHDASLERLEPGGEIATAVARDGRLLYFLPIDCITWTAATEKVLDLLRERADTAGYTERELILSGTATEPVKAALAERGMTLRERFSY